MPTQKIVAKELADVLRQLSHPDRIRVVLKLQVGSQTVSDMAADLNIPPTRLSQHLAVLRGAGLVEIQVNGKNRIYRLTQPGLALWLIDGVDFIAHRLAQASADDVATAKRLWKMGTSIVTG
jgi:DNA-binding transcriptional ArsR family regulator